MICQQARAFMLLQAQPARYASEPLLLLLMQTEVATWRSTCYRNVAGQRTARVVQI